MVVPIDQDNIFKVNMNYEISSFEDNVLVVDNIFDNTDLVDSVIHNTPVPIWKKAQSSRNFIDYYDCRLTINTTGNFKNELHKECLKLIRRYMMPTKLRFKIVSSLYEFNYFKNLTKNVSSDLQFFPHRDYKYTCLIYLDDISSGGTALYHTDDVIENKEDYNIFYDTSSFSKTVIPAKKNRLIIFEGSRLHGGYIENHNDYLDGWRINQCFFFN